MSKPFKIVLIAVAVLISFGLVRGTYLDTRGGSDKTQEGIETIEESLKHLDSFKEE